MGVLLSYNTEKNEQVEKYVDTKYRRKVKPFSIKPKSLNSLGEYLENYPDIFGKINNKKIVKSQIMIKHGSLIQDQDILAKYCIDKMEIIAKRFLVFKTNESNMLYVWDLALSKLYKKLCIEATEFIVEFVKFNYLKVMISTSSRKLIFWNFRTNKITKTVNLNNIYVKKSCPQSLLVLNRLVCIFHDWKIYIINEEGKLVNTICANVMLKINNATIVVDYKNYDLIRTFNIHTSEFKNISFKEHSPSSMPVTGRLCNIIPFSKEILYLQYGFDKHESGHLVYTTVSVKLDAWKSMSLYRLSKPTLFKINNKLFYKIYPTNGYLNFNIFELDNAGLEDVITNDVEIEYEKVTSSALIKVINESQFVVAFEGKGAKIITLHDKVMFLKSLVDRSE